ncbi:ParA family protein [Flexivirga oryzae]|uniref:Chromosome partitioning protein n=1 Tax=Flexivirga oryzae TaxID=1794944 RepID=A0A839NBQ5_9MICO|nr:chromosome partitioning protein [Flexivirga oryzae]
MTTSSLPTGWHEPTTAVASSSEPVGWRNAARLHPTVLVGALHPVPAGTAEHPVVPPEPATVPEPVSRETSVDGATAQGPEHAPSTSPLADELVDRARRRQALAGSSVGKPAQPRVLTISNQKGGVGKTTTTVNVAAALAQFGLRVLVIDIDPQGNASTALGIPHHAEVPSVYDVVVEDQELAGVLQECPDIPGLWCAPATIDLAGAELELVSLVARESRLKRAIEHYQEHPGAPGVFDFILIDCPPSLGLLTVNAFVAAREVFIPIQCEYYALEGLSQLLKNIELIRAHLNPELHVSTILLTMYDARTRLSAQVADEVRNHFTDQVLKSTIPRSVRISEAPSHGQTVLTYDPSSSGALSYAEAAKELAARSTTIAE